LVLTYTRIFQCLLHDASGKCMRMDRLDNNLAALDHYFSMIEGGVRVTFESTRNWYRLADYFKK
jgi:hypothetical protein